MKSPGMYSIMKSPEERWNWTVAGSAGFLIGLVIVGIAVFLMATDDELRKWVLGFGFTVSGVGLWNIDPTRAKVALHAARNALPFLPDVKPDELEDNTP